MEQKERGLNGRLEGDVKSNHIRHSSSNSSRSTISSQTLEHSRSPSCGDMLRQENFFSNHSMVSTSISNGHRRRAPVRAASNASRPFSSSCVRSSPLMALGEANTLTASEGTYGLDSISTAFLPRDAPPRKPFVDPLISHSTLCSSYLEQSVHSSSSSSAEPPLQSTSSVSRLPPSAVFGATIGDATDASTSSASQNGLQGTQDEVSSRAERSVASAALPPSSTPAAAATEVLNPTAAHPNKNGCTATAHTTIPVATTTFYDVVGAAKELGMKLCVEPATVSDPPLREATIIWEDCSSDGEDSHEHRRVNPPQPASRDAPPELKDAGPPQRVRVILVEATLNTSPVATRPPPLEAHKLCSESPVPRPIVPPCSTVDPRRTASEAAATDLACEALCQDFTADELVEVRDEAGMAVRQSTIAESLRMNFLRGCNTMLMIVNTPQCTTLAEDALTSAIAAVFADFEAADANDPHELSIVAHALYQDGSVRNLLPTKMERPKKTRIRLGMNPIMGTCIVNDAPVKMWSLGDAQYLSHVLLQNVRLLGADPLSESEAVLHVTLQLRRRVCTDPQGTPLARGSTATEAPGSGVDVYLSSMQLLWVGSNYAVAQPLLDAQRTPVWPLYREAFGGKCETTVMAFRDHRDNVSHVGQLLRFCMYLRGFLNRPPRSGSVSSFLRSTECIAQEELKWGMPHFDIVWQDAKRLLGDLDAEPCLYTVTPRQDIDQLAFVEACHVVVVPASSPQPQEPLGEELSSPSQAPARVQSELTVRVSPCATHSSTRNRTVAPEVLISMPSELRGRLQQPNGALRQHRTQRRLSSPASVSSSVSLYGSSRAPPARVRMDRQRRQTMPAAPGRPHSRESHTGGENVLQAEPSTEGESDTTTADSERSDGPFIATSTLLITGPLEPVVPTGTFPAGPPPPLPVSVEGEHGLVLNMPASSTSEPGACAETRRFHVDAVSQVASCPAHGSGALLRCFKNVRDACHAFRRGQRNVALLVTHCAGPTARPFQDMPAWAIVEGVVEDVMREDPATSVTSSQLTVFASLLRGRTIIRDLAEVGSSDSSQAVDGRDAQVGLSPLFGSLLYETRGVDLSAPSEAGPVLRSVLAYADEAAGDPTDMYVVMTVVRKAVLPLLVTDAATMGSPECNSDVSLSSFTMVCTRNTTNIYEHAVAEMLSDEAKSPTSECPFALLSEMVGGSCQTVSLVIMELRHTPSHVALQVLKGQEMLSRVQNEAPRNHRVRAYVCACRAAADVVRVALRKARQGVATDEEDSAGAMRADKEALATQLLLIESLAQQHIDFLKDGGRRGFMVYPVRSRADVHALLFVPPPDATPMLSNSPENVPASPLAPKGSSTLQKQPEEDDTRPVTSDFLEHTRTIDILELEAAQSPASLGEHQEDPHHSHAMRQVSPMALRRDSGIAVHSLLLLVQQRSTDGPTTQPVECCPSEKTCSVSTVDARKLTVDYGLHSAVYEFDEIVQLDSGNRGRRMTELSNHSRFSSSPSLRNAVAVFLAGYNASIVLQETMAAQKQGTCAALCQHLFSEAVAGCPAEAAFFVSVAYVGTASAVDLLKPDARTMATVRDKTLAPALVLGKSPQLGSFPAAAEPRWVCNPRDVFDTIARAFQVDALITTSGASAHLLVCSLWQKLYVSAEEDVCLSSLSLLLPRGPASFLKDLLASQSFTVPSQLLRDALRGPCYSVCGVCITNWEPQPSWRSKPSAWELLAALTVHQSDLMGYTGKPLRYNSVLNSVKNHRAELAKTKALLHSLSQRRGEGGNDEVRSSREEQHRQTLLLAVQNLQRIISDEEALLLEKASRLKKPPRFYAVQPR